MRKMIRYNNFGLLHSIVFYSNLFRIVGKSLLLSLGKIATEAYQWIMTCTNMRRMYDVIPMKCVLNVS